MSDIEDQIRLDFQHHDRLSGFNRLVYPVVSRRAGGLSLGINLNPDKACNFDCVYCQVDRSGPVPELAVDLVQLEDELRFWLDRIGGAGYRGHPLRDIAIAGDGEPTTEKKLPAVLTLLDRLVREYRLDDAKRVLFTNGSGLLRRDLEPCWEPFYAGRGEVWLKLDYWDEESLARISRTRLSFERLLATIAEFAARRPVVLQSCFFQWQGAPWALNTYRPYVERVRSLLDQGARIERIQAYTLARQPAEAAARPWPDEAMRELADLLRRELPLEVELYFETGAER